MTLTCSPFTTAVQWTNSRLHLLIDWPVRARQCTRRQNKPCCYTQLTQQRMNTQIFSLQTTRKLMEKRNPLVLSHQSGCWADRLTYLTFWQVSQNGLIQAGVTTLSELPHAEFWPCLDLCMCVVYTLYGSELQLAFTSLAIFFSSQHIPRVSEEIKCS